MNAKSLSGLNLTDEQMKKYKELEHKEKLLRRELRHCKVSNNAIDSIVNSSDLNKVDENNLEALDEAIRNEWKDFIFD